MLSAPASENGCDLEIGARGGGRIGDQAAFEGWVFFETSL